MLEVSRTPFLQIHKGHTFFPHKGVDFTISEKSIKLDSHSVQVVSGLHCLHFLYLSESATMYLNQSFEFILTTVLPVSTWEKTLIFPEISESIYNLGVSWLLKNFK